MRNATDRNTPPPAVTIGQALHCLRCNYMWRTIRNIAPKVCPRCKQHKWWMPPLFRRDPRKRIKGVAA